MHIITELVGYLQAVDIGVRTQKLLTGTHIFICFMTLNVMAMLCIDLWMYLPT